MRLSIWERGKEPLRTFAPRVGPGLERVGPVEEELGGWYWGSLGRPGG